MGLEFTGERYVPEIGGEIRLEHMHRYAFSLPYVRGMTVLDVACGEGYGSALLATAAESVLGVDISPDAVESARRRYGDRQNLHFQQGDATALDLPDASFNVVVSFETIEHVIEQESMMQGYVRVLKPGGLLILSSPDKRVYSDLTGHRNEFHVRELYRSELEQLVQRHFQRAVMLGQRLAGGSAIFPLGGLTGHRLRKSSVYVDGTTGPEERAPLLDEAVYLLVLATNGQTQPTVLPSVMLTERDDPLVELKRIARWASGVHGELVQAQADAQAASAHLEAERLRARELEQRLATAGELADVEMDRVRKDMSLRLADQLRERESRIELLESRLAAVPSVEDAGALPNGAGGRSSRSSPDESAVEAWRSERDGLMAEVARLRQQVVAAEGDRDSWRSEAEKLRQEVAEASAAHQQTSSEMARMTEAMGSITQHAHALQAQLATQTKLAEDAREREQELLQGMQRLQARNEQLASAAADASARAAEASARADAAQAASAVLREQAAQEAGRASAEHARLQAVLERQAQEIQATAARHELALDALQGRLEVQLAKLDAAQEALREAADRTAELQRASESSLHALGAENDRLRAQAEQAALEHAQVVEQLEREATRQAREHEQRLSALEARLQQLQDEQRSALAEHEAAMGEHAKRQAAEEEYARRLSSELVQANRRRAEIELALNRQAEEARRQLLEQAQEMARQDAAARRTLATLGDGISTVLREIQSRLQEERKSRFGLARLLGTPAHLLGVWVMQQLRSLLAQLPRGEDHDEDEPARPLPLGRALRVSDGEFLHEAYRAILGRAPDEGGLAHYGEHLRRGVPRLQVLRHLRLSPEGQARPPDWDDLDEALAAYAASRVPLLGRAHARRVRELTADHPAEKLPQRSEAREAHRLANIEYTLGELARGSSLLAEAVPLAVALGKASPDLGIDAWAAAKELVQLDDDDFVRLAYALLRRRPPDDAELRHARQSLVGGSSRAYLAETLLSPDRESDAPPAAYSLVVLTLGNAPQLPAAAAPRVSIVIPVHGHLDYTLRCLRAVAMHTSEVPAEVIVVDDASPDGSGEALSKVSGLRLLVNETNLGFVGSCNRGAAAARGELLCFLNNDTEVRAGWLDEMCRTFETYPGTGLVGAKLVYPDGTLQEAGSILFADGSAANIGRGGDASAPAYSHAREVDYCSGACIVVPRHLFEAIGGFDERYSPAYCEDSDLALQLSQRGYRVVYQAQAVVVHHEGVTAGTDVTSGVKLHQSINTVKLRERWHETLAGRPMPSAGLEAALAWHTPRRLLAIELRLPRPDRDAGSVSVVNQLMLLRDMGYQVTLMVDEAPAPGAQTIAAQALFQRCGVEVLLPPRAASVARHLESAGRDYEAALIFRPVVMERHGGTIRRLSPRTRLLYYPHDLHFVRIGRQSELTRDAALARESAQWRERELKLSRTADLTLVPSRAELDMLVREAPDAAVELLPLQLDTTRGPEGRSGRRGMLFVGHFGHAPNVDALAMLLEDLLPRMRQQRPEIGLTVVGADVPRELLARRDPGVTFLGPVADLAPVLASAMVAVVPLRFGAGAKGKVARAMAAGLPVVASSLAIEGMDLVPGQHVLIGDNADAMVGEVLRLHDDTPLWQRLADAGHERASELWGPRRSYDLLAAALGKVGLQFRPPRYMPRLFREATFMRPEHRSPSDSPRLTSPQPGTREPTT